MYVGNLTGANNNLKEYVMSPTDQFLEVPLKHSQAFIEFMNEERKPKEKPQEKQAEVVKPSELLKIEEVKKAQEIKFPQELPETKPPTVPTPAVSDTNLFQSLLSLIAPVVPFGTQPSQP